METGYMKAGREDGAQGMAREIGLGDFTGPEKTSADGSIGMSVKELTSQLATLNDLAGKAEELAIAISGPYPQSESSEDRAPFSSSLAGNLQGLVVLADITRLRLTAALGQLRTALG